MPDPVETPRRRGGDWLEEVTVEAPGVDEVGVEPWPLLYRLRRKAGERLGGTDGRPDRWFVLAVTLAGLFTVSVTITILAVSQVDIADDLGTTPSIISWAITGPMLVFGIVGPAAGKAGDVYGQKKVFLIGLAGAGIFALLTALSWNSLTMISFRTLSAAFGAAAGPSAMAMINRMFDADERVRALGFTSFVNAGAPVLGVVIGGPIVEAVGWRAIFWVQAPLCLVGFLVSRRLLPETERGERSAFDGAGAALLGLGVTSLLFAINRGAAWGWTNPYVLGAAAAGSVLLAAFLLVEHKVREPLLPPSWLRRRNLVAPITSQTLSNFAYMGGFIITPVLLEDGLGITTATVGLLIIARPLAFALAAPGAGFVTVRVGERVAGVSGAGIVAVSMLLLAAIGHGTPYWFIAVALGLSGVGLGISSPALGATVANAVRDDELGTAGALQQLMTQVGAVVGIQVMQGVQSASAGRAGDIGSYGYAYYVGAVVAGLGAVAALAMRAGERGDVDDAATDPALATT